ncbi:MAG: hypothetical protein WCH11_07690 [Bdellovibrio sp.]
MIDLIEFNECVYEDGRVDGMDFPTSRLWMRVSRPIEVGEA